MNASSPGSSAGPRAGGVSDRMRFARFAVVGGVCFLLTVAVFTLLDTSSVHYLAASVMGYAAGMVVGFTLNRLWTFEAGAGSATRQGVRFVATSALGIMLNVVLLKLLVAGLSFAKTPAEVVSVLLTSPVTFLVNRHWSFA